MHSILKKRQIALTLSHGCRWQIDDRDDSQECLYPGALPSQCWLNPPPHCGFFTKQSCHLAD